MNCHRVQSLLSAYLDQELSPDEWRQIRNHLFNCSHCAKNCEELTSVKNFLGNLEPPSVQIELLSQIHRTFGPSSSLIATPMLWSKRLGFSAICVFLFLLTSFYLFPVNNNGKIVGKEAASPPIGKTTPYRLVSEDINKVNLFLEEEKTKNKDTVDVYLRPEPSKPLPGIPVSR
jgi:hypothetical protein